jgi:hypothetical protein
MACVVTADMLLFFVQAGTLHLHVVGVLKLEVLKGLRTCNEDELGHDVTERDLGTQDVAATLSNDLLTDASLLVPLPHENMLIGDVRQRHELSLVLGTESDTHEFFVLLFDVG